MTEPTRAPRDTLARGANTPDAQGANTPASQLSDRANVVRGNRLLADMELDPVFTPREFDAPEWYDARTQEDFPTRGQPTGQHPGPVSKHQRRRERKADTDTRHAPIEDSYQRLFAAFPTSGGGDLQVSHDIRGGMASLETHILGLRRQITSPENGLWEGEDLNARNDERHAEIQTLFVDMRMLTQIARQPEVRHWTPERSVLL